MKQTKAERVLAALAEFGPMTRFELAEEIGVKPDDLFDVIKYLMRMRTANIKDRPHDQCIYTCRWVHPDGSHRWRAVYKLGRGANKPRPEKAPRSEVNARYWAKRTAMLMGSSVFRLGASQNQVMRKGLLEAA